MIEPFAASSTQPLPTPVQADQARFAFVSMPEGDGAGAALGTLLKRPGSLIYQRHQADPWHLLISLAATALVCLSVHRLIIGSFSEGTQRWAAPAKTLGGTFLCPPFHPLRLSRSSAAWAARHLNASRSIRKTCRSTTGAVTPLDAKAMYTVPTGSHFSLSPPTGPA